MKVSEPAVGAVQTAGRVGCGVRCARLSAETRPQKPGATGGLVARRAGRGPPAAALRHRIITFYDTTPMAAARSLTSLGRVAGALRAPATLRAPAKRVVAARAMSKSVVATDKAPAALGPYSQAVRAGDALYVSGQIGLVPGTKDFAGDDVEYAFADALPGAHPEIRDVLAKVGIA